MPDAGLPEWLLAALIVVLVTANAAGGIIGVVNAQQQPVRCEVE